MVRVVVDTNHLLRMAAAGEHAPLFMAWRQRSFDLVTSTQLLTEFRMVISRSSVRRFLSPGRAQRFLQLLITQALVATPATDAPTCRDPKDNMVIATAVGAQAQFIVTADLDLLDDATLKVALEPYKIHIVYPAEFLSILREQDE